MPRNKVTPAPSYKKRLESWDKGKCPYCGGSKISATPAERGGTHYICLIESCGAENYFSKRRETKKPSKRT